MLSRAMGRMAKPLAFALLLLSFAPFASATVPTVSPVLGDWLPVAGAALLVSFLLVALAYMIGMGFRYHQVEQWAKVEFWEAMLTLLMVAVIFFFAQVLTDISYGLAGGDHFSAAFNYLNLMRTALLSTWMSLLLTMEGFGFASAFSFTFFLFIPLIPTQFPTTWVYIRTGTTLSLAAGFGAILQGLSAPLYMVYFAIFANMAQDVLLHFAKNNMLKVFLPLGVLFRAFPLTRKIGGTVIAMALALYFVFPLSLAINVYIFQLYAGQGTEIVTGNTAPPSSGWDLPSGTVDVVMNALDREFLWIIMGLFLFILDLIVTITAFRSIAEAIGGDPQIFGMGKLGI